MSQNDSHYDHQRSIDIAKRSDATVLILGPTGSGKSTLAREIHQEGGRKGKPFITVNLASSHEGTLESELFGHEKGAFTGADQRRIGKLELAQGGTVFLDEIGELAPRLQAKLLEFLQTKTVTPLGSAREVRLDVRVIAATHRDLDLAVTRREFREDLFHRLRVISIGLKPLSESWASMDEIVHRCLEDVCRKMGRSVLRISEEFAERLEAHDWPGNYRELRNVLEFAVLAGEGPEITERDFPEWFCKKKDEKSAEATDWTGLFGHDYYRAIHDFEKHYLQWALARYQWRINLTARKIGINKTTLLRRIRFYGLKSALVAELEEDRAEG